jgi:peptidoglycan/LPS O-acetylase OafA/YrhL
MTKCDGLALGALLAVLMAAVGSGALSPSATRRKIMALGVGSVAYLALGGFLIRMASRAWPAINYPPVNASLRVLATNLMFFSFTGLLIVHSGHARLAALRHPGLILLGQMSYGIYLYHYILFDIIQDFADRYGLTDRLALDGIKIAASLGVAYASWRLIEEPLLRLKDRFEYRAKPIPRVGEPLLDRLYPRA